NVLGLLYGQNFRGLCEALAALDMNFGAIVMDAKYFLPQSRPRVFIVAVDRRIPTDGLSVDASPKSTWVPSSLLRAYDSLPPELQRFWRWWQLPTPPPRNCDLADVIEDEPTGVNWNS